jgi:8-oxo-dGTP diphosphatase
MPRPNDVGVGIAVALLRPDGRVLLGKRKGAHGAGLWSFPGGWIDRPDETIDATCVREVKEETGITIERTRRLTESSNDYPSHGFRAITLFRWAEVTDEEAEKVKVCEPGKCEEWRWFSLSAVQRELFGGVMEAIQTIGLHQYREFRPIGMQDTLGVVVGPRRNP